MPTMTAIVSLRIADPIQRGVAAFVQAEIVWPQHGRSERHTLGHDWSSDTWDWRGHHMPDSLVRLLRDDKGLALHGCRYVYISPQHTGTSSNETGRVMILEVDYDG